MQSIQDKIKEAIKSINDASSEAKVVGSPIVNGDGTIILPVNKVSLGFVVGGADISTKAKDKTPTDVSGGGITITPLGFLICGHEKKFVRVDGNNQNKWLDLFNDVIACMKKD